MKHFILILLVISFTCGVKAQQILPDSLRKAFQAAPNDSVKFKVSRIIYTFYEETNRDSALYYAQLRYALAQKYNRKIEEAYVQGQMAYQQIYLGRFSEALTNLTEAIQIATETKDEGTWELTPFSTPGKSRQLTLSMLNHMWFCYLSNDFKRQFFILVIRRSGHNVDHSRPWVNSFLQLGRGTYFNYSYTHIAYSVIVYIPGTAWDDDFCFRKAGEIGNPQ